MKITDGQLETIIANEIKENGLNGVFDKTTMEKIKEKLKSEYKRVRSASVETLIPEGGSNPSAASLGNSFPYGDEGSDERSENATTTDVPVAGISVAPAMEVGSEPTDQHVPPKVYTPELPDVLKNVTPKKLVVMELGEISENGENLSNRPFRSMDNLDKTSSMKDHWREEGCTKAEIYLIKFERAGEMTFDHANGTTLFVPTSQSTQLDVTVGPDVFKENPYTETNPDGPRVTSGMEEPSQHEIETYVKTSVNVEDIVKKVAMEMMAKAYEERSKEAGKENMGLTEPETPLAWDAVPAAVYESFQLGQPVKGVRFLSNDKGVSKYVFENKEYAIYDSVMFGKK